MIKRFAFASLAVVGLAGQASALDAQPGAEVTSAGDAEPLARSGHGAAVRRRAKRVSKPQVVAVLPPGRPEEMSATLPSGEEMAVAAVSDVPAPAESRPASALADVVQAPPAPAAVAVLPPLRPSIAPAASALANAEQTALASVSAEPESTRETASVVATLPPARPTFRGDARDPVETASLAEPLALAPEPAAVPDRGLFGALFGSVPTPLPEPAIVTVSSGRAALDSLIAAHAKLNGVPADLVHRVVIRESRYNPRAVGRGGAMGLMQIKTGTARGLGYDGTATGLLDAGTNLTYAVKYLAGAYRTANGDYGRAISYYARGYYYAAKRNGNIREAARRNRRDGARQEADATPPGVSWNTAAIASEATTR